MSLLWKTATEQAGKAVFHPQFPVSDLGDAEAGDFDFTRGHELGRGMFEHDGDHPDYYDHLTRDIAQHGVRDPIHMVRYPDEEGGGHSIQEGHHRVSIAQDLGIPHVPVYVHHPLVDSNGDVSYPSLDEHRGQMKWDSKWDALRKWGDD